MNCQVQTVFYKLISNEIPTVHVIVIEQNSEISVIKKIAAIFALINCKFFPACI